MLTQGRSLSHVPRQIQPRGRVGPQQPIQREIGPRLILPVVGGAEQSRDERNQLLTLHVIPRIVKSSPVRAEDWGDARGVVAPRLSGEVGGGLHEAPLAGGGVMVGAAAEREFVEPVGAVDDETRLAGAHAVTAAWSQTLPHEQTGRDRPEVTDRTKPPHSPTRR